MRLMEITPKGRTTYEMPEWIGMGFHQMWIMFRSRRSRVSFKEIKSMFPKELQDQIKEVK